MRGLKRSRSFSIFRHAYVASFTDAWIETLMAAVSSNSAWVASFTDAWIETPVRDALPLSYTRRIFYRCVDWNLNGKKTYNRWISRIFYRCVDWNLIRKKEKKMQNYVASFTDAWIETFLEVSALIFLVSHLLQMRGLKQQKEWWSNCFGKVASFTDAWIETRDIRARQPEYRCRIFYRCVDWNTYTALGAATNHSRIFYRCVDWNL